MKIELDRETLRALLAARLYNRVDEAGPITATSMAVMRASALLAELEHTRPGAEPAVPTEGPAAALEVARRVVRGHETGWGCSCPLHEDGQTLATLVLGPESPAVPLADVLQRV